MAVEAFDMEWAWAMFLGATICTVVIYFITGR